MNILYLINHAGKGGSEKYVKSMAGYAKAQGDSIFFAYNEPGPLVMQMEGLPEDICRIEMNSPMDIIAAKKLAKYCKANSIDLIHTQFARENYIAILSKKLYGNKAKIIHTCHINTPNNQLWRMMNKFFMNENTAIIAVCNSVRDLLIANNYPENKIQLVHNGIYYREDIERADNGNNPIRFISLMRFSEEKGVFFLLESAKRLLETGVKFSLVIAGDGPLYNEAASFVKNNGLSEIVILPGHSDDVQSLLINADCYINASSSEALSFAILEAMESGLSIIATNVGGNPDIVNDKTNCGLLVPYGDTKEMANAMLFMIENPSEAKEMAENARKAVKDVFNIDNSLKTTYNVYMSTLSKRNH